jgi:hypothetical protein
MSRRTWLFIGVAFGFAIPHLVNSIQRPLRPSAHFLFWPGLILVAPVTGFLRRSDLTHLLDLLTLVADVVVFGAAAYGLRKGFMILIAVMLVICYVSLPPSDAKLEREFAAERVDLERSIQKANQTPIVVAIGKEEMQDIDGRNYKRGEKQSLLSSESWVEYRETFKKTGMNDGLYRSPRTAEVQFLAHTILGKLSPPGIFGTFYGFVYCPPSSPAHPEFMMCKDQRDTWDDGDYRYKRVAPDWFIVEIFATRNSIN